MINIDQYFTQTRYPSCQEQPLSSHGGIAQGYDSRLACEGPRDQFKHSAPGMRLQLPRVNAWEKTTQTSVTAM